MWYAFWSRVDSILTWGCLIGLPIFMLGIVWLVAALIWPALPLWHALTMIGIGLLPGLIILVIPGFIWDRLELEEQRRFPCDY